jgi:hypothetical protein
LRRHKHGRNHRLIIIIVDKLEGNRSLPRPRCGWDDNIKIDREEVRCGLNLSGSG